jgi:predicted nuclease with TOPRIM domain
MKTYKDLNVLIANINAVLGEQQTKTQKKLFKIYEKLKAHHEDFQSQFEDLRLDNAATNADGILLLDEKKEYQFNKDGIKKLSKDIEALNKKSFDFTPVQIINPQGLETFTFLEGWVEGIEFVTVIEEEEEL